MNERGLRGEESTEQPITSVAPAAPAVAVEDFAAGDLVAGVAEQADQRPAFFDEIMATVDVLEVVTIPVDIDAEPVGAGS